MLWLECLRFGELGAWVCLGFSADGVGLAGATPISSPITLLSGLRFLGIVNGLKKSFMLRLFTSFFGGIANPKIAMRIVEC